VARSVHPRVPWLWTAAAVAGFCWYSTVDGDQIGSATEQAVRTGLGIVVGLGLAWLGGRHARRRVGGLTGDVLGALCEVATTGCLVVLASGVWGA
jgi:adenosylcobinamide-GDP ribazoletransferase